MKPFLVFLVVLCCYASTLAQNPVGSGRFPATPIPKADTARLEPFVFDSLKNLNLPTAQYSAILDSIRNLVPVKTVPQTQAELNNLEHNIDQKVSKLSATTVKVETDVSNEIQLINKTGIPVEELKFPKNDLNLPASSSLTEGLANPVATTNGKISTELNPIGGNVNNMSNPAKALGALSSDKDVANVQKEISEARGYSKDIKAISHGNLDSAKHLSSVAEKKAVELTNVKELQGKTAVVDQYKQAADPEAMKQLAMNQFKSQAGGHFAGKEKELQSAMQQLAKYKQKYTSLASTTNLPKRVPNAMHGRPFVERILPGITTQIIAKGQFMIDLNPQLSYIFNPRLTAGLGWNERIGFQHHHFNHRGRVFGPRSYAEYSLGKGFVGRGEFEVMNTYVPTLGQLGLIDNGSRQWVPGLFVGLKKGYRITRYLNGNIQTMYNLLGRYYVNSPYPERLNVRIGFELPLKKKDKLVIKPLQILPAEYSLASLESKIKGLQGLARNQVTTRLVQYPSAKNALTISKGITNKYRAGRQAYLGARQYRFDYQKKLRLHEIKDSTGNVLATTKDFRDVTMADGKIYCFLRMSATECDYVNKGKEVVRARKNPAGNDIDIIWASEAERNDVLEIMCRMFLVKGK